MRGRHSVERRTPIPQWGIPNRFGAFRTLQAFFVDRKGRRAVAKANGVLKLRTQFAILKRLFGLSVGVGLAG